MLVGLGRWARRWASTAEPWSNVYGLARTMLASATALTLLCNAPATLFRPAAGIPEVPQCDSIRQAGLFCLTSGVHLELGRWLAILILVVIATGWRPRFTGVLHWWVTFSLQANATLLDGGDNAAAVLTLLLIPVTLTDPRRWHWENASHPLRGSIDEAQRVVALMALWAIRLQVAGIYFHAAIGKFALEEWTNGTILYYVLTNPMFGTAGWRLALIWPILLNGPCVALLAWSVLGVEYLLSAGLLMARSRWKALLWMGIGLHGGIMFFQGLVSFSLTMFAALVLYLRPVDEWFRLPSLQWFKNLWATGATGRATRG